VRPPGLYWDIVGPGRCVVQPSGANTWSDKLGPVEHAYLVERESVPKMAELIEELMTHPSHTARVTQEPAL
jgi:hypothetical protein